MKDSIAVHDKVEMLNCLNEHFISSGFLFNSTPHSAAKSVNLSNNASDVHNAFNLTPFMVAEVHKALKQLNLRKTVWSGSLGTKVFKISSRLFFF